MIFVLIFGAIGWSVPWFYNAESTAIYFVSALIGILVGILIAMVVGTAYTEERVYATQDLVALRSSDYLSGSFFIGCGSVGTTPYYVYYVRCDDGSYKYQRINANQDNVRIVEEDRKDGIFETSELSPPQGTWWYALSEASYIYRFRIPGGSIRRDFTL